MYSSNKRAGKNPVLGADNLLRNCVDVRHGDKVLIVSEPENETHYDYELTQTITRHAISLGAIVTVIDAPIIKDPKDFPQHVVQQMSTVDHTLFLNRSADYVRFIKLNGACSKTICYALDVDMLESGFGAVHHELMTTLLRKLETELDNADYWQLTCPLGTNASGTFCWPNKSGGTDDDFTMNLFPVTTFKPVPCSTATGKFALSRWLIPGGAPGYQPATLNLDEPVFVHFVNGAITHFEGNQQSADAVSNHYENVGKHFGIDKNFVHSWHIGMNPLTAYHENPDEALERWSSISFASPRYLHFHTCGDYAPGEIAWSAFKATVIIDGKVYWQDGEFVWLQRADNKDLISQYPGAEVLLRQSECIGV